MKTTKTASVSKTLSHRISSRILDICLAAVMVVSVVTLATVAVVWFGWVPLVAAVALIGFGITGR